MGTFARHIIDQYPYKQYAYDGSDNLIYRGRNENLTASDDDSGWLIDRYDYDASNNLTKHRFRRGSWTDRTSSWS